MRKETRSYVDYKKEEMIDTLNYYVRKKEESYQDKAEWCLTRLTQIYDECIDSMRYTAYFLNEMTEEEYQTIGKEMHALLDELRKRAVSEITEGE